MQFQGLLELFVVLRFDARVRLGQRLQGFLHQTNAYPFAILGTNDRTVLRAIDGERLFRHPVVGFVRHFDH